MPLFQPLQVPRTKVSHLNLITYDNDSAINAFYRSGTAYFGKQSVPPDNKWPDGTPSFMAPISHFHLLQSETFHIKSGRGIWYLANKKIELGEGEDITISPCISHRFENMSGSTEPLVIEYRYDPQRFAMEERFFRNMLTYLDDCRKVEKQPSLLQLCVFLAGAWMPGDILPVPTVAGEYVKCFVNAVFMWVLAAIGWAIFGYRISYKEYYDPGAERNKRS
ncbi:hypothetical protein M409DRAFT_61697 [Zasmidium cellare ATCC 36951]|uniref:Cupin 2 conserved barrel domain-containing protein n=1 Tax=Zasmidium cellare ATCC 36951 TaxID=1080233 RepID=A0A6A6BUM8_ZASCE|nr:uncharacterized protein M409DRAFT_61697 [Zasmidium cellare ATCC 36951]KAF2158395.1 hypothetical protein M409DRAFT_61697 [Zasmidium cellare ATCC 36951]